LPHLSYFQWYFIKTKSNVDGRSLFGCRIDVEFTTKIFYTRNQIAHTDSSVILHIVGFETDSVVLHGYGKLILMPVDLDEHFGSFAVLNDIVQQFLNDSVQHQFSGW